MDSWLIFRGCGMIFNQSTKWDDGSSKLFFAGSSNIPCNLPTNYRPIPIATKSQTALSAFPFVSERRGVDVPWFLDRSSQAYKIPGVCQCKWPLVSWTAPRTFASSFQFLVKFLFCTDKIESIELLSLVPQLHVGDCFEIHFHRWEFCDLLLSSHQKFCAKYDSTNTSSARNPCNFGPLTDLAISVFREMSLNTVITRYHSSVAPKEGSWEELACESLSRGTLAHEVRDSPWILAAIQVFRRKTGSPVPARDPHFWWFWILGCVWNRISPFSLICSLTINQYWDGCSTFTSLR